MLEGGRIGFLMGCIVVLDGIVLLKEIGQVSDGLYRRFG